MLRDAHMKVDAGASMEVIGPLKAHRIPGGARVHVLPVAAGTMQVTRKGTPQQTQMEVGEGVFAGLPVGTGWVARKGR